jgi:hypothetical protein
MALRWEITDCKSSFFAAETMAFPPSIWDCTYKPRPFIEAAISFALSFDMPVVISAICFILLPNTFSGSLKNMAFDDMPLFTVFVSNVSRSARSLKSLDDIRTICFPSRLYSMD